MSEELTPDPPSEELTPDDPGEELPFDPPNEGFTPETPEADGGSVWNKLVDWLFANALSGGGMLKPAAVVAQEHMERRKHRTPAQQIDSLIWWSRLQNFSTGFATGVWGFAALPLTIPASLASSLAIQMRLAAAIAHIAGHDIQSSEVRQLVLATLFRGGLLNVAKTAGVQAGTRFTKEVVARIPGWVFKEINKEFGKRVVTKAGTTGLFNATKLVPVAGGIVGGALDQWLCARVGQTAKAFFLEGRLPDE